jgi:hypothetical protein
VLGRGWLNGAEGEAKGSGNSELARSGSDMHRIFLSTLRHHPVRRRVDLTNQQISQKA